MLVRTGRGCEATFEREGDLAPPPAVGGRNFLSCLLALAFVFALLPVFLVPVLLTAPAGATTFLPVFFTELELVFF